MGFFDDAQRALAIRLRAVGRDLVKASRVVEAGGQRGYRGGRVSRRNEGWYAPNTGANATFGPKMTTLRARSRERRRNDRYAKHALAQLMSHFSGITPRSAIRVPLDATDSERERIAAVNAETDDVFNAWSKQCSVDSGLTYLGQEALAVHGMCESGETFTRRRWRRLSDGLVVPLQLEVLESDFVDHMRDEAIMSKGNKLQGVIKQGVEFDPIGRRAAYHMHREHPGEVHRIYTSNDTVRILAGDIAHLYPAILQRPAQVRGEPWLHAVLEGLADFAGYQDAERVRMRGAASFMAMIESEEDPSFDDADDELPTGFNPVRDSFGKIIERIKPGAIAYLQRGQSVRFNAPPTTTNFAQVAKVELHGQAAGSLLPYEIFTGDLSDTSYSSIMFGMSAFWSIADLVQLEIVAPLWIDPTWNWFVEAGQMAGALSPEAGPVSYLRKPRPLVDPVKQTNANRMKVRSGAMSLRQWIEEEGQDFDSVMAQNLALAKWARDNNVLLDSIPTLVTLAGMIQHEDLAALAAEGVDSSPESE